MLSQIQGKWKKIKVEKIFFYLKNIFNKMFFTFFYRNTNKEILKKENFFLKRHL
jgi:hypothetical protein